MHPLRRLAAFLAAATLLSAAPAARADSIHFAYSLLQKDDKGGSAPATPPPTLADVAGPSATVTLPDLLALAIQQAPDLRRAKIDLEIADAQVEQARGIEDWTVGAELSASRSKTTRQLAASFINESTSTKVGGSADLSKVFSWGGRLAVHGESGLSIDEDATGTAELWLDNVTATWTEPVLEGRGKAIVRAEEARARIARDSASLQRYQSALAVVRDVVNAYWELVFAQRDLEIRQSSLELANERLRRTQAGIKGGGLARTEALEVEQVVATREEEVLGAELTVVQRSIALRRLVGMEIGPKQLGLTTATDLGVPSETWDLDALVGKAYETSPELALLAEQGKGAAIEVEVTENGVLPNLDVTLFAGPQGSDPHPSDAIVEMAEFGEYSAGVSVTFEHSLGNHGAKGAARAARAQRLKITIDDADARAQIAQALAEAVLLAESASRRVEIAGRAIELAEQNIVAEQSRYGLGKSTNFDVLQRQDELKQAQLRQARAIIDWHEAATGVAAISGTLLTDFGISLPE